MRQEFQQRRAEWIERRKQEKRERKARGLRAASSSGSCSSDSAPESCATTQSSDSAAESAAEPSATHSGVSSGPPTPPLAAAEVASVAAKLGDASTTLASSTQAYRRVRVNHRGRDDAGDSRLRGADLYVVRLLQDVESKAKAKEQRRRHQRPHAPPVATPVNVVPRYADSRPCWRCLEWMLWAGIKRVYWTNAEGEWHGGKVSMLLFGPEGPPGSASHTALVPVHLTQYEHAAALLRAQRTAR